MSLRKFFPKASFFFKIKFKSLKTRLLNYINVYGIYIIFIERS